jgi:hypothetical protein
MLVITRPFDPVLDSMCTLRTGAMDFAPMGYRDRAATLGLQKLDYALHRSQFLLASLVSPFRPHLIALGVPVVHSLVAVGLPHST